MDVSPDIKDYENKLRKRILYQRASKKLISLSYRDFDQLESILDEKLRRYIRPYCSGNKIC